MKLWLAFILGLKEISSHGFRSFLTMLGVILGVASLMATFALTAGIAHGMRDFMSQIGGLERVEVSRQEAPEHQQAMAEISPGPTVTDAEAIEKRAPLVNYVCPVSELNAPLTRAGETFRATIYGCWPTFVPINKHEIQYGRPLSQLDLDEARNVVLIGQGIVKELWPERRNMDVTGEKIQILGRPFTVVGVFTHYEREEEKLRRARGDTRKSFSRYGSGRGGRGFDPYYRKNTSVQIPITTMFQDFKTVNIIGKEDQGPNYKLDQLLFQVGDLTRFHEANDQVRAALEITHRGIMDFQLVTREEWSDGMEKSIRSTRLSGGIIAAISLIVGGIGITNIMMASITERIREIGVRRAIGAKGRDIFIQIVVEAGVIGILGGLLGIAAGAGLVQGLQKFVDMETSPVLEPASMIISFCFAVIIGILSGLYPAVKASKLDPIEALRYG